MKGSSVPISHVLNGKGTLLPCLPFYLGNGTRYGSLEDYPTSFVWLKLTLHVYEQLKVFDVILYAKQ